VHHWICKPTIFEVKMTKVTSRSNFKFINFNVKENQFSPKWHELWLRLSIIILMNWTSWRIHSNLWRGNGFCKDRALQDVFFLLLTKSKIFSSIFVSRFCYSVHFSVCLFVCLFVYLFVCLSVCLSVCLTLAGHNFKPIFTKLHHVEEFVKRNKPIVFEVKRWTSAKGQQPRWNF